MDIRKIKKLIELLENSGLAEIEIKEGDDAMMPFVSVEVQRRWRHLLRHLLRRPLQ